MFAVRHATDNKGNLLIQDPPIAQLLFQSTKASIIWLVLRLWMAYAWLEAGWHKFTDPAWIRALAVTTLSMPSHRRSSTDGCSIGRDA